MLTFSYLLMTLLLCAGIFLIGLILLQRGRGGGLAGAFGGMGGQSAFGTKAGDVFTRITIGAAAVWILLCAAGVITLRHASSGLRTDDTLFKKENPAETKKANPVDGMPAEEVPASPNKPAAPDNDGQKPAVVPVKPAEPETKLETKPETKPEEKPAEPAPANSGDNPEPKKETTPEEKPAEPPK